MDRHFRDSQPHTFQLQVGHSADNQAADWENVGLAADNVAELSDDETRVFGAALTAHYRLILNTPVGNYISEPANVYGELDERNWLLAQEMVRKERLRLHKACQDGYVIKRMRFGDACTTCTDPLTGEITNSSCPECGGVGVLIGYHPPIAAQFFDVQLDNRDERRDNAQMRSTIRDTFLTARVVGFPMLLKEDAWVDAKSDRRYFIHRVQHLAELRGVPIVAQVELRLAPFSEVIYGIEVGGEPSSRPGPYLPRIGGGSIVVDHDYGGEDALAYRTTAGLGIVGATVKVYSETDYDTGNTTDAAVIARTYTSANGRWAQAVKLDPGNYVLEFSKIGSYGPDIARLTVESSSSSVSQSSSSSLWSM